MPAAGTSRQLVALSVTLEVITKDKLKKFVFGLSKGTAGQIDSWSMSFEMQDRADTTADFSRAFALDVDLDLQKIPADAVEATATNGLNKNQVDFARTMVAADAEKFKAQKIKEDRMKRTARGVITARNG